MPASRHGPSDLPRQPRRRRDAGAIGPRRAPAGTVAHTFVVQTWTQLSALHGQPATPLRNQRILALVDATLHRVVATAGQTDLQVHVDQQVGLADVVLCDASHAEVLGMQIRKVVKKDGWPAVAKRLDARIAQHRAKLGVPPLSPSPPVSAPAVVRKGP